MQSLKQEILQTYLSCEESEDPSDRYEVLVKRYLELEVDRKIASEGKSNEIISLLYYSYCNDPTYCFRVFWWEYFV